MTISDERRARHDNGEWMDWKTGEAMLQDDRLYEAEMMDGTTQIVSAVVTAEDEGDVVPFGDEFDDSVAHKVARLRLYN